MASEPAVAHHGEDNPSTQLTNSLRAQIDDLLQQVGQLNGKLVQSYDRVSDLEDTLHVTSTNLRSHAQKISELEIERAQHLSALNTGLLVEKDTITTELSRLMERVTEETAQRGVAENAKEAIEKDLDDLSASLFNQANTMVAEARYARAMSERKADEAEAALRSTEEVVSGLQTQMQTLTEDKERAEREANELRQLVGPNGGALVSLNGNGSVDLSPRFSTVHLMYQEFLLFNSHLRSIRSPRDAPPSILTLSTLPFISRLQAEDSDPTLRLDFAPSLNFLSRRAVASAILAGQLSIEPVPTNRITLDPSLASSILGPPSLNDLTCALCGKHIYILPSSSSNDSSKMLKNMNASAKKLTQASSSWASTTSRFFKTSLSSSSSSNPSSPPAPSSPSSPTATTMPIPLPPGIPTQTYVFRIALPPPPTPTTPTPGGAPTSSQGTPPAKPSTTYPICHASSGTCLRRLRATCELWRFVREGVIGVVWTEPTVDTHGSGAPPPQHPRSGLGMGMRGLSYTSLMGGAGRPSSPSPAGSTNGTAAGSGVSSRVGNLWSGISGSGSRSTSPVPSNWVTPRRLPPALPSAAATPSEATPSTDETASTSEVQATTPPVPSLPPRRRVPPATDLDPLPSSSHSPPEASAPASEGKEISQSEAEVHEEIPHETLFETRHSLEVHPAGDTDALEKEKEDEDVDGDGDGFKTPPTEAEAEVGSVVPSEEPKDGAAHATSASAPVVDAEVTTPSADAETTPAPKTPEPVADVDLPAPTSAVEEPAPTAEPGDSTVVAPPTAAAAAAAPPPLPRRAAARAPPTPSRSATPKPQEPTVEAAPAPPANGEGSSTEAEPTKTVGEEAAGKESELSIQPAVHEEDEEQEPKTPTTTSAPVPIPAPLEPASSSTSNPEPPTTVSAPATARMERAYSVVSVSSRYSSEIGDASPSPLPPPPVLPPRRALTNGTHSSGPVAFPSASAATTSGSGLVSKDGNQGTFVEPVSWEEKTWKELAKLREDMFWARIGGWGPGSGEGDALDKED